MDDTPIYRELVAGRAARRHSHDRWGPAGGGAHQWRTDPPPSPRDERDVAAPAAETRPRVQPPIALPVDAQTKEVPVARHGDDDLDGVNNQNDPDWLPDPPPPVTPLGPDDPDDPVYSRSGDHEPPRWPEPTPTALDELQRAAADVDPAWLALAAVPIADPDGAP